MKMRVVRMLSVMGFALALGACSSVAPPVLAPAQELFHDQLFKPSAMNMDPAQVFALSPAMRDYLDREIAAQIRKRGPRDALLDSLYTKGQLQLEYDSEMTRNAAEAFAQRRGNCLSLVIMTGAFAKHLQLPVRFQSVYVDEFWSRQGDLYFLTGHVNLSLARRKPEFNAVSISESDLLTIDFLPGADIRGQRSREIDEQALIAMYMNNRAAESLAAGALDAAYWWARAALNADPRMMAAYNTLGVVYRRHGYPEFAQASFRHVLRREPDNTQALSNLVLVLQESGASSESTVLAARLRELQPHPPYKFFDEGVAAMRRGDYAEAKALFDREIARSAFFHEFHFWASLASYGLGDFKTAHKHMAQALENSSNERQKQLYTSKMDLLKAKKHIFH